MADYRTIHASFWTNPDLLRLPWHARVTFAYLFSAGADDEGRFHADPLAILRNAFSPIDGLTTDDIAQDLQSLAAAGMILLYGDGYGFLTGWYRHQYIERRIRKESHLPAPPVTVNSWEVADKALEAYSKHTGKRRVYFRDAVTWWTAREGVATDSPTACDDLANYSRTVSEQLALEGKGKERKGISCLVETADGSDKPQEQEEPQGHPAIDLFPLPDPTPQKRTNGKKRRPKGRPSYRARTPEEMDADEEHARSLLQQAGLLDDVELLLQGMADNAASGKVSQLTAIRTMQLMLHAAQQYGVMNTRRGIVAALRREEFPGPQYAETVAKRAWQYEEAQADEEADSATA